MTIFNIVFDLVREALARMRASGKRWWRHYGLALEYRAAKNVEERILAAQKMKARDLEKYRRNPSTKALFPQVWDYYIIAPGRKGWRRARANAAHRADDEREFRQRLRPRQR
jgi:hypothetical protein